MKEKQINDKYLFMAIETKYKIVNDNSEYSCGDIGISSEEWYQLLKHPARQVHVHQHVRVRVTSIDHDRGRIALSMRGIDQPK